MVLRNISSDQLLFLTTSIALFSALWALFSSTATAAPTSLVTTAALCASALGFLYFHGSKQHRHHHHSSCSPRNHVQETGDKEHATGETGSSPVILPDFVSIEKLGRPVVVVVAAVPALGSPSDHHPQLHASTPSTFTGPSSLSPQQNSNVRGGSSDPDPNTIPSPLRQPPSMTNDSKTPLVVVTKETLDNAHTQLDYRIWDHVVVGEGREAFEAACHLALQNPSRTILAVLEDDIREGTLEKVVHWMQLRLSAQAQRLWAQEASRAMVRTNQDSDSSPSGPNKPLSDKTMSMDLSALPPNLCISPNLRASKILVDKPIINTPAVTPTPKPVRRFSSIRNESPLNHLTIDTATLAPARTVGLEVTTTKGPAGAQCQLFCHQSVVFANDRHPLLRSLDAAITPPIYRDHAGRRTTLVGTTEDASSQRSKMVFTIGMQHFRQAGDGTSMQRQWLLSIASHLDRFLRQWTSSGHHHHHAQVQDGMIRLHPVLLHQSDRIVESWRVRPSQPEDIISETLRLEISATTASLQPTSPIQLQVKVMTQPIVHDAFGNTDMIRKGEAVLMEGLALARMMAKAVGWTCQEEDDSHMVEWVRDQMNIQWDHEPASKVRTLHPVCSHVEGLQTYSRSRTASGGGGGSRVMTPSLSPYPSRSQSFRATRKSEHGSSSGGSEKRDSTLAQLQEVSENLEVHARKVQPTTVTDEDHLRVPPPKDGSTPPSPQQRPGLRTSFGGFSSLNDSRMQTRALAAETEDHLSKALVNKGSPSIGSSSPGLGLGSGPQERHKQEPLTGAFSEGIGLGDLLGGYNNNNNNGKGGASPEPRKLSKFSIKSYQLERSNGLSDDWGIGGIGSLDTSLGKATMSGTTSGSGDLLSTPPLIADIGLPGTVSPITPSPEQVPVTITGGTTDFLQGLNITVNGARHDGSGIGISISDGIGIGLDSVGNQDNTMMLEANPMEQKSRRSFSSFSIRNNGHNSNLTSNDMMHKESASLKIPSPLEAPAELIHDFLGESLAMSPKPTKTSMERARSDSDVTGSSTKSVHFAADEGSGMGVGPIHRVHSDPITTTTTQPYSQHHHHHQHQQQQQQQQQYIDQDASSPGLGLSRSSSSSSSLSGESPTSKAHHTRRSWGKGIGGNDILGLQGLSE